MESLATLTRRLELKEVRQGDRKLPGTLGFRGELLIDCSTRGDELKLQLTGLRRQPTGFELTSGPPTADSIQGLAVCLRAENPARALRIISRPKVKEALQKLDAAGARYEVHGPSLTVVAKVAEEDAALRVASTSIAFMEELIEACREVELSAASHREAAKLEPPPPGPDRRFVAVSPSSLVDEDKLDSLRRLARALGYWRNKPHEIREELIRCGATPTLAEELMRESVQRRRSELRAELLGHAFVGLAVFALGVVLAKWLMPPPPRLPNTLGPQFLPSAAMIAGALALLGRGVVRYLSQVY